MNKVASMGLLILVASMIFAGVNTSAYGATDPSILLTLAQKAQNQIKNQITDDSPSEIKELYEEGVSEITSLEESLENEDLESAKEHFLKAMKIFTKLTHMLNDSSTTEASTQARSSPTTNFTSDLERIHIYVSNLKLLAKKYNAPIEFEKLDELFAKARQQINSNETENIPEIVKEIKLLVLEINNEIRDFAEQQEQERAKKFAEQYLEQLERLIESAKNQGVSEEIIEKLENAKERLSTASNPQEIVNEIKEIISIKQQFELTKNDRLESRVMQVQKTILRLAQIDSVDPDEIEDARESLAEIKDLLGQGEFEAANELLRDLNQKLQEISNSL